MRDFSSHVASAIVNLLFLRKEIAGTIDLWQVLQGPFKTKLQLGYEGFRELR